MNIAASSQLVSRLLLIVAWWRWEILILRTSRQSSLPLRIVAVAFLRCLSAPVFHLPVFYPEHAVELPAGVTAVINGNSSSGWSWNPQPVSMKRICCHRFMTR
ncbi:hypothetical protein ACLB1S_25540 [Escherichia coli]